MKTRFKNATEAWQQFEIPVIVRTRKIEGKNPRLRIRLPEHPDPFALLKGVNKRNRNPIEKEKQRYWELAYGRLNEMVETLSKTFGHVILIQPVRETMVCARKCIEASGFECECSCLGANHGSQHMDSAWYEIEDTYAVSHGAEYASLKVILPKDLTLGQVWRKPSVPLPNS